MSEAALLSLTQWLSPAFPVGSYAWSGGLEQAVADGRVASAEALAEWLGDVLMHGAGRSDAILLAMALRPGADHAALARMARALAPSRERLAETEAQGAALAATVNALTGATRGPMPYPVALGAAAAGLGLAPRQVVALYLHAFASNLVQAGVRFVPLGQTEGQKVLAGLHGTIEALADAAVSAGPEDLGTATLGADLTSMAHETLEVRLFQS